MLAFLLMEVTEFRKFRAHRGMEKHVDTHVVPRDQFTGLRASHDIGCQKYVKTEAEESV